jgi:hypothetical protein
VVAQDSIYSAPHPILPHSFFDITMTKTLFHILVVLFFCFLPSLSATNSIVVATFVLMARIYPRLRFNFFVDCANGTLDISLSIHGILRIYLRLCFVKGILAAGVSFIDTVMEITKGMASQSLAMMVLLAPWVQIEFLKTPASRSLPEESKESKEFDLGQAVEKPRYSTRLKYFPKGQILITVLESGH